MLTRTSYTIPTPVQNITILPTPAPGWTSPDFQRAYNVTYQTLKQRSSSSSTTDKGPIIGGVVGGIGGALIIVAGIWFTFRRRKSTKTGESEPAKGTGQVVQPL